MTPTERHNQLRKAISTKLEPRVVLEMTTNFLNFDTYDEFIDNLTNYYEEHDYNYRVDSGRLFLNGSDVFNAAVEFLGAPVQHKPTPLKRLVVYKRTGPTGKICYGLTSQTVDERAKKNGAGYKDNDRIAWDIYRYGWDSFKTEIVASNLRPEEADELETRMIRIHDATNPDIGYNINDKLD